MSMIAFALLQAGLDLVADVVEMDAFSWIFMLTSMGAVTALTIWCYSRILRGKKHFDPDGTGPAHPPVKGRVERGD
jgi:hypothetical protein